MAAKFVVVALLVAAAQGSGLGGHSASSFSYGVADPHTGDVKNQHETRVGNNVVGQYSLLDSDGTKRTVDYAAGPHSGFNAVVRKDPVLGHAGYGIAAPLAAGYGIGAGLNAGYGIGAGLNAGYGIGAGLTTGYGVGIAHGIAAPVSTGYAITNRIDAPLNHGYAAGHLAGSYGYGNLGAYGYGAHGLNGLNGAGWY